MANQDEIYPFYNPNPDMLNQIMVNVTLQQH